MKAVNLLPPDLRGAAKPASALVADEPSGRMGAFAVLGALAFCVVALAAYVLTSNTVKDRQAQLDQVSAEAATVAQQAAKLKPYADFAAQAQQRVQTVKDLASARFDWEQALRDVSRAVPADVTLSTLNGSISTGSGASGLRGTIPSPAIDMQGCTKGGQSDVATLLSRLRDVDGVTRVSLQSSQRPAPGTPTQTTAAPTGAPAGCGAGRPSQFSLVIFFEHSTVPATVDDIGTGASSAPAGTATGAATAANGAAASSTSSSSPASTTSSSSSTTSTPTSTTPTTP
jgi:Tfp pilus assembly protein PilN